MGGCDGVRLGYHSQASTQWPWVGSKVDRQPRAGEHGQGGGVSYPPESECAFPSVRGVVLLYISFCFWSVEIGESCNCKNTLYNLQISEKIHWLILVIMFGFWVKWTFWNQGAGWSYSRRVRLACPLLPATFLHSTVRLESTRSPCLSFPFRRFHRIFF